MWEELLPQCVGGTMADHDAPDEPTVITGYKLTDTWVELVGEKFSFGGAREFTGINGGLGKGQFIMRSPWLTVTITLPNHVQLIAACEHERCAPKIAGIMLEMKAAAACAPTQGSLRRLLLDWYDRLAAIRASAEGEG